jgi:hypothetical protein
VRRLFLILLALVGSLVLAQEEETEEAAPDIVAFTMSDASAASKELEAAIGKIRGAYEEKPILFLTVNLATPGGRRQGEMLFTGLGVNPVWPECRKAAGQLVLVNLEPVEVLVKLGAKDDLARAFDKQLAGGGEEGDEGDE